MIEINLVGIVYELCSVIDGLNGALSNYVDDHVSMDRMLTSSDSVMSSFVSLYIVSDCVDAASFGSLEFILDARQRLPFNKDDRCFK